LADDHSVVRKGMSLLIEELLDEPIIHHASTINDALTILGKNRIDFLILDINFPEGNSVGVVSDIKHCYPGIKILVFPH